MTLRAAAVSAFDQSAYELDERVYVLAATPLTIGKLGCNVTQM